MTRVGREPSRARVDVTRAAAASFDGARTERVDASARERTIERIARCVHLPQSAVDHAVGARARVEGDDASSIGDGDESARGDDDDDDARVVAHDGDV